MAYVQFWKGLAANYRAESHSGGIYQCTDTGDTYIFGTLNSGKEGSDLVIGETAGTAFDGARGKAVEDEVDDLKLTDNRLRLLKKVLVNNLKFFTQANDTQLMLSYWLGDLHPDSGNWLGSSISIPIPNATTTADGVMSAADKKKLDGISSRTKYGQNDNVTDYEVNLSCEVWDMGVDSDCTLTTSGSLQNGEECFVVLKNDSTDSINVSLPNGAIRTDGKTDTNVSVPAEGYMEMSILKTSIGYLYRIVV